MHYPFWWAKLFYRLYVILGSPKLSDQSHGLQILRQQCKFKRSYSDSHSKPSQIADNDCLLFDANLAPYNIGQAYRHNFDASTNKSCCTAVVVHSPVQPPLPAFD